MNVGTKTHLAWVILNFVGVGAYFLIAVTTWNLDHALGGLFLSNGLLNLIAVVYAAVNFIWLALVFIRIFQGKDWRGLVLFLFCVMLWGGMFCLDIHMDNYWYERAQEALSG